MIDPASQAQLKEAIADCIGTDQGVLDALREEIRPLKSATRRIRPRATTSRYRWLALMAATTSSSSTPS